MDISVEQAQVEKIGADRLGEKLDGLYNPSNAVRAKMYMSWLKKQAKQRQKTLDLDGVKHSKELKIRFRAEKKAYIEEAKRIEDAIIDGDIK